MKRLVERRVLGSPNWRWVGMLALGGPKAFVMQLLQNQVSSSRPNSAMVLIPIHCKWYHAWQASHWTSALPWSLLLQTSRYNRNTVQGRSYIINHMARTASLPQFQKTKYHQIPNQFLIQQGNSTKKMNSKEANSKAQSSFDSQKTRATLFQRGRAESRLTYWTIPTIWIQGRGIHGEGPQTQPRHLQRLEGLV